MFFFSATTLSPTCIVGTNAGHLLLYLLEIPEGEKRSTDGVTCTLAKEIKLQHRAPVMAINVIDAHGLLLDSSAPVQSTSTDEKPLEHRLLICSEEQIKVNFLELLVESNFVIEDLENCVEFAPTLPESGLRLKFAPSIS